MIKMRDALGPAKKDFTFAAEQIIVYSQKPHKPEDRPSISMGFTNEHLQWVGYYYDAERAVSKQAH